MMSSVINLVKNRATPFEVGRVIMLNRVDVNTKDDQGKTAMHYAAERGERVLIDLLISHEGETNTTDDDGETPLFGAVRAASYDAAAELLEWETDPNIRNGVGKTALDVAMELGNRDIIVLLKDANPLD